MTSDDAAKLERKRAQNREAQARRRRLVDEGKEWFCLKLNQDLVATALFASGRDRGLQLTKHVECERLLTEWVNELLKLAVTAD
jgi:hypothetical protein